MSIDRRTALLAGLAFVPAACFEGSCYESNAQQKKFLDDLAAISKKALATDNPLAIEEGVKQTFLRSESVGSFSDWCGTLKAIEGNTQSMSITLEIGPRVSLYAFNDWALATAGAVADLFSTRSRESPPPGLSEGAVAALKTFRLGERVQLAGRMGAIAGSGLFDLSRLLGRSDTENRVFLQSPRFVARIEALAASSKK
ncbi:MAG: hypothetical protein JOY81_15360 [Alphaproteobacteria bacterium]|nr:hypothetical protein [Alphaproteobacteria bacterium]